MKKNQSLTEIRYEETRNKCAELIGRNPSITDREVCEIMGITNFMLKKIQKDKFFHEKMESVFGANITQDLLLVDVAMIREAQSGNVQAARYLAERHGKFVKKYQIEVKSPYELFAKEIQGEIDSEEAEYEEMPDNYTATQEMLPPRDPSNDKPRVRKKRETKKGMERIKQLKKERSIKFKSNRSDRAKLRHRAEKVGLPQLPQGRPKEYIRKMWLEKLYKLEEEAKQKILDENK